MALVVSLSHYRNVKMTEDCDENVEEKARKLTRKQNQTQQAKMELRTYYPVKCAVSMREKNTG